MKGRHTEGRALIYFCFMLTDEFIFPLKTSFYMLIYIYLIGELKNVFNDGAQHYGRRTKRVRAPGDPLSHRAPSC